MCFMIFRVAAGRLASESNANGSLPYARSSRRSHCSERGVRLGSRRGVKRRRGVYSGELRMVERVICFEPELAANPLLEQRKILEDRHVEIVDARSAENVAWRIPCRAYGGHSKRAGVEILAERPLIFGQNGIRKHDRTDAIATARNVHSV